MFLLWCLETKSSRRVSNTFNTVISDQLSSEVWWMVFCVSFSQTPWCYFVFVFLHDGSDYEVKVLSETWMQSVSNVAPQNRTIVFHFISQVCTFQRKNVLTRILDLCSIIKRLTTMLFCHDGRVWNMSKVWLVWWNDPKMVVLNIQYHGMVKSPLMIADPQGEYVGLK